MYSSQVGDIRSLMIRDRQSLSNIINHWGLASNYGILSGQENEKQHGIQLYRVMAIITDVTVHCILSHGKSIMC